VIDLNTVLLTILLGLGTWTLIEVHRHGVTLGRVMERVWGTDGSGGHTNEIQKLRTDIDALRLAIVNIRAVLRMEKRRADAAFELLEVDDA
jgi:hypothetical protein